MFVASSSNVWQTRAMYTVGRAAKLTGISPDTLRVWQRRYAVVEPVRSKGGYRLYDDPALRRLAAMKSLVDAGWGPSEAARRVVADVARGVDIVPVPAAAVLGDTAALARVGREFDGPTLDAVLDDGFALGSFEQVVDSWLMPALAELGGAWRDGSVSVAGEHFVSAAVARRLAASFDAAGRSVNGPGVVVGLARGCRHELGVLAFAAALRRAGLSVIYVGGDLPPEEWVNTIRVREAVAVVLGVPTPEDVPAVRETVQAVSATHPGVTVYVGGGYQSEVGGAAQPLGHAIGAACLQLAESLPH
jgi:methylmalonyl-CoA mutase cobalamin-binding subunit